MKGLLIYQKFPDTFWSFNYALNFIRKKAAYPPLGLLTVAAMLSNVFLKPADICLEQIRIYYEGIFRIS